MFDLASKRFPWVNDYTEASLLEVIWRHAWVNVKPVANTRASPCFPLYYIIIPGVPERRAVRVLGKRLASRSFRPCDLADQRAPVDDALHSSRPAKRKPAMFFFRKHSQADLSKRRASKVLFSEEEKEDDAKIEAEAERIQGMLLALKEMIRMEGAGKAGFAMMEYVVAMCVRR